MAPRKLRAPVSDDAYRAIGRIVVYFSLLEFQIFHAIWFFLGVDQKTAETITAGLSFKRLIDMSMSLYRLREADATRLAAFEDLLNQALKAEDERNRIMHSTWTAASTDAVGNFKITARKKHGHRFDFAEYSVDDLDDVADRLSELSANIQDFVLPMDA